jgi:hypothetical protein
MYYAKSESTSGQTGERFVRKERSNLNKQKSNSIGKNSFFSKESTVVTPASTVHVSPSLTLSKGTVSVYHSLLSIIVKGLCNTPYTKTEVGKSGEV